MAGNFGPGKSKFAELVVVAAEYLAFQFVIQFGTPVLGQLIDIAIC